MAVDQPLEANRRLGYVPETPAIYESLSVSESATTATGAVAFVN